MSNNYYAQFGTDQIIKEYFPNKNNGKFYKFCSNIREYRWNTFY